MLENSIFKVQMGCQKLTYYESETTLGENWKVFASGIEKTASSSIFCKDYYAGGSIMPGRSFSSSDYRYGYNAGSEKDDEITGVTGSHITTFFREFDTRLLRTWSVDPVFQPWQSPYTSMDNNPILLNDPMGDKPPTKREAARMAAHAYGDKKDDILKGGWAVSKRDFGIDKNVNSTGFKSQVYERVSTSGKNKGDMEYVYATAGTDGADGKDWNNNASQTLGLSAQYAISIGNAVSISDELSKTNSELTFTGHSLGGGQATANAYATGRDAITFNAAGVSSFTQRVNPKSKIDAYILLTDPLNYIQNGSSRIGMAMPDVNGIRHYLMPKNYGGIYNGHSMENVLRALDIDGSIHQKSTPKTSSGPSYTPSWNNLSGPKY